MIKKSKSNGIRTILLVPILSVVFISMASIGLLVYKSEKDSLTKIMQSMTSLKVEETKGLISERETNVSILKQSLNKYLISITKSISEALKDVPDDRLNSEAERLVKEIGVSEIHITDGNGVLRWGSVPAFYGFDFNTSEQTKPFLSGLTDKNFALAQEPELRGTDKQLFQYITVARIGKQGLVQIGITPKELQELMDKVNVTNIGKSSKLGKEGYVVIFDKDGKMISHPDDKQIGKTLKDFDWGKNIESTSKGSFKYVDSGIDKLMAFEKTDNYIIAATIPTKEYYGELSGLRNALITFTIIALSLCSLVIFFISNRYIVIRIRRVLSIVKEVGDGNLQVEIEDKRKDEIGQLTFGINHMVDSLKELVTSINVTSSKLNHTSETVSQASEQTSAAALEIAKSVNEIARGTSSQAEEVQTSVEQLEEVTQNISEITSNTKLIAEKAQEIDKQNISSINSINELKDKFGENKQATENVNNRILMLVERSNKIGTITESISAISSQTNLLALNASIEAARAGESGRGFAVVADEVRKLAEQSAEAANSIDALIKEVKSDVADAVKSIDLAGRSMSESDEKLNNTVGNFYSLKESNDSLVNLIEVLDKICNILNANTDKVVNAVSSIASVSEETAATTEEISAATEEQTAVFEGIKESTSELNGLSNELIELVRRFKIDQK